MHYHHEGTSQRRDIFSPSHDFHSLLSSFHCGAFSKSVDRRNFKLPISRVMTNTSRRHVHMARDCEDFLKKMKETGQKKPKQSPILERHSIWLESKNHYEVLKTDGNIRCVQSCSSCESLYCSSDASGSFIYSYRAYRNEKFSVLFLNAAPPHRLLPLRTRSPPQTWELARSAWQRGLGVSAQEGIWHHGSTHWHLVHPRHICVVTYLCFRSLEGSLERIAAARKITKWINKPLTWCRKNQNVYLDPCKCLKTAQEGRHLPPLGTANSACMLHQLNHLHRTNDQPGSHLESCVCCLCVLVLSDLAVDSDVFEN